MTGVGDEGVMLQRKWELKRGEGLPRICRIATSTIVPEDDCNRVELTD